MDYKQKSDYQESKKNYPMKSCTFLEVLLALNIRQNKVYQKKERKYYL